MEKPLNVNLDLPSSCPPLGNSLKPSSAAPASKSATPVVKANAPVKAALRSRGEKLGDAFATLNSQDRDRADFIPVGN